MSQLLYSVLIVGGVLLGALLIITIFSLLTLAQKGDVYLDEMERFERTPAPSADRAHPSEIFLIDDSEVHPCETTPKVLEN